MIIEPSDFGDVARNMLYEKAKKESMKLLLEKTNEAEMKFDT